MSLSLLYMLDVIHLIVTVLSDCPSFKWACNVIGQPIWFRPLKLTFLTWFSAVVVQHGRDADWGFGKRTVGGARGSDWVVLTSHFYGSHKGSWKSQLINAGCVQFTVDWLFWNLYGSYIIINNNLLHLYSAFLDTQSALHSKGGISSSTTSV